MIEYVSEFHDQFSLPSGNIDFISSDPGALEFRIKFLQEELDEFKEAMEKGDKVEAFDALLDLAYVTYGTALFLGILPSEWNQGMKEVHRCNMNKVKVINARDSKRGSSFDIKKPEGWTGPESRLRQILNREDEK